jgi:excinuclease ABC subunit B
MSSFAIQADYKLTGDQPQAVDALTAGVLRGDRFQTLMGVTGSGKTFTMANVIARVQKPTLVIAHNKTLAAQLCNEFREFLPNNAVEYFVSYYDYYQPEAYVPAQDLYIEKDSSRNDEIDRLRHAATSALFLRRDVVIVASVSCIYNLGSPEEYVNSMVLLAVGHTIERDELLRRLVEIQYARNDFELARGKFRVRGDSVEVWPADDETALKLSFWGDEVESIVRFDPVSGEVVDRLKHATIYPATHFVIPGPSIERALKEIRDELEERVSWFESHGKLLEAHRLRQRTLYDMEMLRELGFCNGVENYSRILAGKPPGATPDCLLDYFPEDFLCFIDESHMTVPQIGGMYEGDRSRKQTLVDYGFRLPSALDNRPLRFDEFLERVPQIIFVSATPGPFELRNSLNVVEQVIRPTGLVDPQIEVRPTEGQIDDLMNEIRRRVERDERVLVTTLTKRMAEDLTDYLVENGFRARYLHSEIDGLEPLHAFRNRDPGAGENPARSAQGRVRCADWHQPAARRARPARGRAGGHPGCRQRGLPARPNEPHSDHRPRLAQHQRHGHHVRRPHHAGNAVGHRRNQPAAGAANEVQPRARHHAAEHRQGRQRHSADELGQPNVQQAGQPARRAERGWALRHAHARAAEARCRPRGRDVHRRRPA